MEGRTASIRFDDFKTEEAPLEHAGLAQGSPLSPILFAFFNADLVDQPVDTKGGAAAYIDYFRWRAGPSAEANLKKIQEEDIPRIEEWARRTGSCFAAEKTELIHLARKKKDLGKGEITMNGNTVKGSSTAKLLGVVFDQELRWKQHVQQAVKSATRTALAMGGLSHLRPTQMRQLYQACVIPRLDYASTIWDNPDKDRGLLRVLGSLQRAVLLKILSAFRTVATQTLEVEAYVTPTRPRLKQRAHNVITNLCTLPEGHPVQKVLERMKKRCIRKGTCAKLPLAEAIKTMDVEFAQNLETIDPRPLVPWRQRAFEAIDIDDGETATQKIIDIMSTPETVVFSDASGKKGNLGAAAVILDGQNRVKKSWQASVGSAKHWSVHAAELIAIYHAIGLVESEHVESHGVTFTIASDSKSALQAIAIPPTDQVNTSCAVY